MYARIMGVTKYAAIIYQKTDLFSQKKRDASIDLIKDTNNVCN